MRDYIVKNKPPRGTCFIYDDAGADKGLSRRRTATLDNIEFNEILQTCRDLGYIIFYTSPADIFISERSLSLFTHTLEPTMKIPDERITLVKFKVLEAGEKEIMRKFLRNETGDRISTIRVKIPPKEMLDEYKAFRKELSMDKIKTRSQRKIDDKETNRFKPYEYAKKIMEDGADSVKGTRAINADKIILFFENKEGFKPIGHVKANSIKKAVEELMKQPAEVKPNEQK
jgi:hypothetical protein